MGTTPWQREFRAVWRREQRFLNQYAELHRSWLDGKIEAHVPEKFLDTLRGAFEKAVALVFDKGAGVVMGEGRRADRREAYQVRSYAADLRENRRNLRAVAGEADRAGRGSVLLSGAAGLGMGFLGMTLPDIPLVTALLMRCVYETAESFGFPCTEREERIYALRVMETALSHGEDLERGNRALEIYAQTGAWPEKVTLEEQIRATARRLAETMLYGKALQNIPVAGAVGGAGDLLCLRRVRRYAAIRYEKRFLLRRRLARPGEGV